MNYLIAAIPLILGASLDCLIGDPYGGSGGQLSKIIETAVAMNSNLRLTVTAVSMETLFECTSILDVLGFEAEITQIAVTHTRKVGRHTMLNAENPIWIIKRKCP